MLDRYLRSMYCLTVRVSSTQLAVSSQQSAVSSQQSAVSSQKSAVSSQQSAVSSQQSAVSSQQSNYDPPFGNFVNPLIANFFTFFGTGLAFPLPASLTMLSGISLAPEWGFPNRCLRMPSPSANTGCGYAAQIDLALSRPPNQKLAPVWEQRYL